MWFAKALGVLVLLASGATALPRPAQAGWGGYTCLFDSGDALPTANCQRVVQEFVTRWLAAGGASTCPDRPPAGPRTHFTPSRIEIDAHSDRAEETKRIANRMAQRRGEAIASLLRANCMPTDAILVKNFAATRPLVPTPPGVDEPQNRRVEILPRP